MQGQKIKSFTDLKAWQKGHELVLGVYRETKCFPHDEQFGLTSQVRRACVSITSNIAEGFSRKSVKEKGQFYAIALGSLTETQNQLLISRDLGYISKDKFARLAAVTVEVSKLINGLIKGVKKLNT